MLYGFATIGNNKRIKGFFVLGLLGDINQVVRSRGRSWDRTLHNLGAKDVSTIVLQFDNKAMNTDVDSDLHREGYRGFESDQSTEVFKRDMFLLLNINQVAKSSNSSNEVEGWRSKSSYNYQPWPHVSRISLSNGQD